MFDIFAQLLSSVASFLFPLFASYKALKTSDPAQLTPWLMYWVVLACVVLVESWVGWFLVWIPFYAYIRLLFLLYLVLPQTQGARLIYEEHIHPLLEDNETAIEEFIASAHDRLRSAGIAYLKRAIELLKTNVLGMPPSPEPAAAPEPHTPQSYTQALLARFTLPTPRWNTAPGTTTTPGSGGGLTTDFYNLLASAVSAAASATTSAHPSKQPIPAPSSATGSIIPESIPSAARMSFIQAQRERLRIILSALDREEAAESSRQSQAHPQTHTQSQSSEEAISDTAVGVPPSSGGGSGKARSLSEQSGASGLSKSRSEGDFEKLELESDGAGAEGEQGEEGVRRRGGKEAAGLGGWMPWGWGGGGEAGRSSGVEK